MNAMSKLSLASLISGMALIGCGSPPEEPVAPEAQALSTQSCTFNVSLSQAQVTEGQGISEGDLELRFEGRANGVTRTESGNHVIGVHDGWRTIWSTPITSVSVNGTRTISIWTGVTELDSGLNGNDDFGEEAGQMTLTCASTVPVSEILTVDLFQDMGSGPQHGQVEVKFVAEKP